MPSTSIIHVAIIEDQMEVREGLRFLIDSTDGFACRRCYRSMEEALGDPAVGEANVALVDIGLPGMSGIDGMREFRARYPAMALLALTVYDDDARIFEALCAGATGYLLKKTPPARLLEALQDVITGGSPMSPEVARRVITLFRQVRPPDGVDYHLTPHEVRLLRLLGDGHSYKTAAAELGSSVNTVGFHMRNIYRKLQVHSKSEAVAKALRHGIFH